VPPAQGQTEAVVVATKPPIHKTSIKSAAFQALCLSAMALPGMVATAQAGSDMLKPNPTSASNSSNGQANFNNASQTPIESFDDNTIESADDDDAGYQYSHYEEAKRNLWDIAPAVDNNYTVNTTGPYKFQNSLKPITVDSEHGYTRFRLSDRLRFAFNYTQDVWSGATPWFTAPVGNFMLANPQSVTGATYQANGAGVGQFFDAHGSPLYQASSVSISDYGNTGTPGLPLALGQSRIQHVLGYASPEMRNQIDAKVGYDWDNASLDVGGGVSIEHDYLSRFGNLAGRFDFNQKRTTLNVGLGYTNSDTYATLNTGESIYGGTVLDPTVSVTQLPTMTMIDGSVINQEVIKGNRQDGAITLALSQVLNKNSVLSAGVGYTRSSGYLSNPYKDVMAMQLDPNWRTDGYGPNGYVLPVNAFPGVQYSVASDVVKEQRPHLRNQLTFDLGYRYYVEPLNAAAKINYNFFHDDWGINAHTFDGEWRQALPGHWTLTPYARYYAQSAASFYTPYVLTSMLPDQSNWNDFSSLANQYFSSDQRLSAYGAISGGVTLGKQLVKGLSMELGYEYYTHKGGLALGAGTPDYADYHYFVANATLRANLSVLASAGGNYNSYGMTDWLSSLFGDGASPPADPHARHRHHHGAAPAGVMFSHMLDKAGEFMLGYRYMRNTQGGSYLNGSQPVSTDQLVSPTGTACQPVSQCYMASTAMSMNMHMLDLMYAPTDWMTLMLMPQFMSMDMNMVMPVAMDMNAIGGGMDVSGWRTYQANGGFGDTGAYAMFKLWDDNDQKVILTQGISIPTGSINVMTEFPGTIDLVYSYGMQLGSGTWDYKPSLTYTGKMDNWFWGGQLSGTHRLQYANSSDYRLGDIVQTTAWGGYQFTHWLSSTVRGVYTNQGSISGNHFQKQGDVQNMWMPEDMPGNYGGSFADVGFGFSASVPYGSLAGHAFSFEWLQPVSTDFNGYQLDRTGALSASWGYKF